MHSFHYQAGEYYAESVALSRIAETLGTPTYVYSRAALEANWRAFDQAFADIDHQVCFAVKANSNLAVLQVLAKLGSGFDIVSGGELARVVAAGGLPSKTVFSGVGKTRSEIQFALEQGIGCFNVESVAELERISAVAGSLGITARISLRVNPDVDAQTHPYISTGLKENKFGIDIDEALDVYRQAQQLPHLDIIGVDCHIGSQLTSVAPFVDSLERVLELVDALGAHGISIQHLDIGGGLGIRYKDETPPSPADYASAMRALLRGRPFKLLLEPGRAIAGNAGVLLTRVEVIKSTPAKHFAVVDAAMNDLLRPALYGSYMDILPLTKHATVPTQRFDVVGPVCETGDFLGKDRDLAITCGDLLAIGAAGAYGFTMSSNYNSRPRAAEVMVDGAAFTQVRARESVESLYALESLLPA